MLFLTDENGENAKKMIFYFTDKLYCSIISTEIQYFGGYFTMRTVGAVVRGIRTPIVREGDDLVSLVRDSVLAASETEHFTLHDRDIVAVTESVVARAAGNYATVQSIAEDVKAKFGCDHIGVIFPILSRNSFAIVLRRIASGMTQHTPMHR